MHGPWSFDPFLDPWLLVIWWHRMIYRWVLDYWEIKMPSATATKKNPFSAMSIHLTAKFRSIWKYRHLAEISVLKAPPTSLTSAAEMKECTPEREGQAKSDPKKPQGLRWRWDFLIRISSKKPKFLEESWMCRCVLASFSWSLGRDVGGMKGWSMDASDVHNITYPPVTSRHSLASMPQARQKQN